MAALAAHRPLTTGPDVKCNHCGEAFPDQAAVLASKAPENPQAYQQTHAGQKFGCPPLFDFQITDILLCILHTLLRLSAVVFKRTITANCDTQAKVDAINSFIKEAHLGCKKIKLKKKDARKTKDTEDINFIGREARVLMHPDMYNTLLTIAIEDPGKRALNEKVWAGLSTYNSELLKPMLNPADAAERLVKSGVVQEKGVGFLRAFSDVAGVENATLYCHMAVTHLPEMVRDTGVDLSEVSQQALEHALKQGKSDMRDFSNKQLIGEHMGLGRNQQVMAKERERVHLEQRVEMPLSRNVRRQLGDGSKEIDKAVERAEKKGLLVSKSQQQVDKLVAKGKQKMDELVAGVLEDRLTLPPIPEEDAAPAVPAPAPAAPAEMEAPLPLPLAAAEGLEVPAIILETAPGDSTLPSPSTIGCGGDAGARGAGRGGAARGAARGRARGTFIGGRRVPKNARAL
ncbi:hypothetical protein KFL_001890010 [Klebsormidium nitens]|uniref:Uncharacterized protein n=1 Tax=Klebsormidium nitens TaxID=105231 RepID=A0A1Y1I6T5_KLENI|nr:hypothetical protein KFL_001890010 [Klebsormidium nitens]|eukprot:GAQ84437.1 hypothetical protein KFL_001890010 [Klebsormidium nitens]